MEKYVIKNYKTGQYVDIDQASGGYPYGTTIEKAKVWYNLDSVNDYMGIFKDRPWELHKLIISSEKF